MFKSQARSILLLFQLVSALLMVACLGSPVDITIGREYHGEYISQYAGVLLSSFRKVTTILRITWGKSQCSSTVRPITELSTAWRYCCWIRSIVIRGRWWWRSRASWMWITNWECGRTTITPSHTIRSGKIGLLTMVRILLIQLVTIMSAPFSSLRIWTARTTRKCPSRSRWRAEPSILLLNWNSIIRYWSYYLRLSQPCGIVFTSLLS